MRIGDRAWLVDHEPPVTPALSDRVLWLAGAIRAAAGTLADDVVPALTSVCVQASTPQRAEAIGAVLRALIDEPPPVTRHEGRLVELPVNYGGVDGPDLDAVAEATGLTAGQVVARHTAPVYRVWMLGFMPGFPYLGPVDPSIQVPRLDTPRVRVPAGSVGLAGAQTGIYPRESPGGWQIIGRTGEWLFDPGRTPPARLSPGDRVRLVAAAGGAQPR